MTIEMTDFIDRAGHLDLVKLHRSRWVSITRQPETGLIRTVPNRNALEKIDPAFARHILRAFDDNIQTLIGFWIGIADGLANGPKMVRPKFEDCARLEEFLLTIPFDQYSQPFPTVFVGWPEEFRADLRRRFGVPCHRASMFHQDPQTGLVIVSHVFRARHADNMTATLDGGLEGATIEGYFDFLEEEDERRLRRSRGEAVEPRPERHLNDRLNQDLEARGLLPEGPDPYVGLTRRLERTGMNLMMCLTYQGWANVNWSNRRRHQELRRRSRNGDRDAGAQLLGEFAYIGLKQEIKITEIGAGEPEPGEDLGRRRRSPHPHWRRGHEHTFHVGPRAEGQTTKKVIPPILVRSAYFKGDLATTGVTYLPGDGAGD